MQWGGAQWIDLLINDNEKVLVFDDVGGKNPEKDSREESMQRWKAEQDTPTLN